MQVKHQTNIFNQKIFFYLGVMIVKVLIVIAHEIQT